MLSTVKSSEKKGPKPRRKDERRASVSSDTSSDSSARNDSDYLDSDEPRKKRRTREENAENSQGSDKSDDSDASGNSALEKILIPVNVSKRCYGSRVATAPGSASGNRVGGEVNMGAGVTANDFKTFEALGVRLWLAQSLSNLRIFRPTAIQKGCIPAVLRGDDCIGCSRTGTGKTVAFAAPMLQKLSEDPCGIFGLVLTATRELAQQIYEQFTAVSGPHPLRAVLITGGADMCAQAIALAKRPHLVVATPGRLADHIAMSGEDTVGGLARLRVLVLDEADRLLVGGDAQSGSMLPDLRKCLEALPPPEKRQTLVFTATMTDDVRELMDTSRGPGRARLFVCDVGGGSGSRSGSGSGSGTALAAYLGASDSSTIAATPASTSTAAIPPALRQMFVNVEVTHREHYLHVLLNTKRHTELTAIIVFCNRNDTATYLHHLLRLLGHRVTALYGQLPQRERTDNLGRFRAGAARILIATDVAARGLDIPEVALVVNYDLPRNPDDYIHRVGRTARAGRAGDAISLVGQRDVVLVHAIEARVGRPLVAWAEEGVNLETRVVRDALTLVGQKRNEALLNIEENREVSGKRKRGKQKLNM